MSFYAVSQIKVLVSNSTERAANLVHRHNPTPRLQARAAGFQGFQNDESIVPVKYGLQCAVAADGFRVQPVRTCFEQHLRNASSTSGSTTLSDLRQTVANSLTTR